MPWKVVVGCLGHLESVNTDSIPAGERALLNEIMMRSQSILLSEDLVAEFPHRISKLAIPVLCMKNELRDLMYHLFIDRTLNIIKSKISLYMDMLDRDLECLVLFSNKCKVLDSTKYPPYV